MRATPVVGKAVIVGRAQCAGEVWLLNESRQLIRVTPSETPPTVTVYEVRGLSRDDRPWGLACLSDHSLWTLARPRALARLTRNGHVAERVTLLVPWIALFGAGDRVLFEPAPPLVASPVLATALPRLSGNGRPWPGLITQPTGTRAELLGRNLVACGLVSGSAVPCWFAGDTHVVLSDGIRSDRFSFASMRSADVDTSAPLRDIAFVGQGRIWLLPTSSRAERGQHAATHILLATPAGSETGRLALESPARLLLAASETRCLLLTVRGELLEVTAP